MQAFVENQVWIKSYPVRYCGCAFDARMTVLSLGGGRLAIHSPCAIDAATRREIEAIGRVRCIIAPGTYHWRHVDSAQAAFPEAETFLCPGIEWKRPGLAFDWLLSDRPPPQWAGVMDQRLLRGARFMTEVAFFHRPSRTLVLTDLVENLTDRTAGTNLVLRLWFKAVFGMWSRPKPAPEYRLGWRDSEAAAASLAALLDWPFDRAIVAHGDNIARDAKRILLQAWAVPLAARARRRQAAG